MADYLLPATVYQPPPRLGRGRQLNTIIEDNEETIHSYTTESSGTYSDRTVIARPTALSVRQLTKASPQSRQRPVSSFTRGPPSAVSSECDEDDYDALQPSSRSSYAGSDAGTVFSDSCPSLTGSHASEATSFVTDSSRNSVSSRGSRNRYPSLLIPRGSWHVDGDVKHLSLGMSPSTKVRLSPEALDRLPKHVPALDAPPSLGDASSIRSESPLLHAMNSAPVTPDMHNLEIIEGQAWGGQREQMTFHTPLEIALNEDESIILSPAEAHSDAYSSYPASSTRSLNDIVRQFPLIPGATPIDLTPITPGVSRVDGFEVLTGGPALQLPAQALEMLRNLNNQQYTESLADSSVSGKEQEMRECSMAESRPRSWAARSPASEYSISQLSIPSPGGFFASLKGGARNTWCSPPRNKSPPPPSSTTAENFYSTPWTQPSVKETILEYTKGNETDGPPTVKQSTFEHGIQTPREISDLYGSSYRPSGHEYEEAYEEGLMKAGGVNMDRTSDWLSAQDTFLPDIRDTDPADLPGTPDLNGSDSARKESMDCESSKAVRFLEQAKAATSPETICGGSSNASSPVRETVFLQAFNYQKLETKRTDVFLHASSRLDSVQSSRIALPKRHVQSLLNTHTSKTLEPDHARPKYRGPFSQNPRNTLDFTQTEEQSEFNTLERQQTALEAIKPNVWTLEAQRTILYNGRLMANKAACERLTKKNADSAESAKPEKSEKSDKKRPRVLDLAGAATASWAWAAAAKWPNAKVCTVQTQQQAELARHCLAKKDEDVESYRPETPKNHKVFSVPHLWQMPFRDNYFDIVSARTLHMHLRATPVPGVESINEWDLTLKECMRVLKPGGVLDFFVMDSGISNEATSNGKQAVNLSPSLMTSANALPTPSFEPKGKDIAAEFTAELQRRGYEVDGGCGHLMARLKKEGFVGVRRQWIGIPIGRSETMSAAMRSHQRNISNVSATSHWINQFQPDGTRKPIFRSAPRPISEVSTISKIVDQYSGVEAVHGPVGSTTDISDMSALLGELLWEEWLVRLRIQSGLDNPESLLEGIDEQFSEWRRSGKAAWRGVVGWARKPSKKDVPATKVAKVVSHVSSAHTSATTEMSFNDFTHGFAIDTPLPTPPPMPSSMSYSAPVGITRRASVRRNSRMMFSVSASTGLRIDTSISSASSSATTRRPIPDDWSRHVNEVSIEDYTISAIDRGEVGEIPMMIIQ